MKRLTVLLLLAAMVPGGWATLADGQTTIPIKVMRTVARWNSYANGLAWDNDLIWISYGFSNQIEQYDPYTGVRTRTLTAPNSSPRGLTHDGTYLWMASWISPPSPSIFIIDPSSGKTLSSLVAPFSGGKSHGMAWDGGLLWVGEEGGSIYHVDPGKWAIIGTIKLPANSGYNPRDLAWETGVNAVWAGYQSSGDVIKYHPNTGSALEKFSSPYTWSTQGLTWDGWFLWVTGGQQASLLHMSQIDVHAPFVIMQGALKPGTNIWFELSSATNQTGNLFVVGWSGSGTRGFPAGGKIVPLTFDNFTVLGLALLPFFSNTVDGNGTSFTARFSWPAVPKGIPFWTCGVTLNAQGVVSVNEPVKYVTQ